MRVSFQILEIRRLRAHERVEGELLRRLTEEIRRDGRLNVPILVESSHLVILDGHHRVEALRALGCRKVPAYIVDYFSEDIGLTTWPQAIVKQVTKEEVIERGVKGDLFPPKTTRHLLKERPKEVSVPLKDLH